MPNQKPKGRILLAVTGILLILQAIPNVIGGFIIFAVLNGLLGFIGNFFIFDFVGAIGWFLIALGIFQLIAGILGIKNCNNVEKAKICVAMGKILIVIAIVVLVIMGFFFMTKGGMTLLLFTSPTVDIIIIILYILPSFSGLLLMILYTIGAVRVKNSTKYMSATFTGSQDFQQYYQQQYQQAPPQYNQQSQNFRQPPNQ